MRTSDFRSELKTDLNIASQIAEQYLRMQQRDLLWVRMQKRANMFLVLEWIILILFSYFLFYEVNSWVIRILFLVPWSISCSLALDNIVHNLNHWPPFKHNLLNFLWRSVGILVFFTPLEIRYHHWEHHKGTDLSDDAETSPSFWQTLILETLESVQGMLPWTPFPSYIQSLKKSRPAHYWEIVFARWGCLIWFLFLIAVRFRETAFFLVPAFLVIGPLSSLTMNLTDHTPGDDDHPFMQATFLEPSNWMQRVLSFINHQTAATHLTHHLFPSVHWVHLRRLQRELLNLYEKYHSPQSLIINTILIGNPVKFISVLKEVKHHYLTESEINV